MTFSQARLLSKTNALHIRRDSWASDKWFMLWRGTWFVFGTALLKPVRATDYTSADLLATDWTTVPAALTGCPITPGAPGGGGPPIFGTPGLPSDPGPITYPPGPGGGGGGPPGGGDGPPLPTPDAGTSLSVTFDGIEHSSLGPNRFDLDESNFNKEHILTRSAPGVWIRDFEQGHWSNDSDMTTDYSYEWEIKAQRSSDGKWSVSLLCVGTSPAGNIEITGGYVEHIPDFRGHSMPNEYTSSAFGLFHGGNATVN